MTKSVHTYDLMGRLTYEANGSLVGGAFVNVTSTTNTYDFLGRTIKTVVQEPGVAPKVNTTTFNKPGKVSSSTDEKGVTTTNTYDDINRVVESTTSAPGESPRINRNVYGYEDITINTLDGQKSIAQAQKSTSIDVYGKETVSYSDALGSALRSTSNGVNTDTVLTLDGKTLASITLSNGEPIEDAHISASVYDRLGNQTHSITNPIIRSGNIIVGPDTILTTSTFDSSGKELSSRDALSNETKYTYDEQGELATVTQAAVINVNPTNNSTSKTSAVSKYLNNIALDDGGTIDMTVDALGRLSQTRSDANEKTLSIIDFGTSSPSQTGGIRTIFEYDALGQNVKETYSNGNYITHTYNSRSELTKTIKYKKGGKLESYSTFSYDSEGRQTLIVDYDGADKVIFSKFSEYDIFGKVIAIHEERDKVADSASPAIRQEYDLLDRVIRADYSEVADTSKDEPVALKYAFNGKGQLAEITAVLKDGGSTKDVKLRAYEYDAYGKQTALKDYFAFAKGDEARYTLKSYVYDKHDRVISMTYSDSLSLATPKESFEFTYDKNSNILSERHINAYTQAKTDETKAYTYDAVGRLIQSVKTNNLKTTDKTTSTYGYDAVGNRRIENINGVATYSYHNGLNQLTLKQGGSPASTTNYTYDVNGNQTSEKIGNNALTTFTYDVSNQITTVARQGKTINTNTYNSNGQRISKTDSKGTLTKYFYQGASVLYTKDVKDNKTSFNLMGGTDNVIATKRYQGNYADKYYTYNKDSRGSTTNILSDSGAYVTSYTYNDYGETTRAGDTNLTNEIAYTGGIYDSDTALYYLNARYYNPNDAHFMTQDTYRGEQGSKNIPNLYAYCEDNPVGLIDPSGHSSDSLGHVTLRLIWFFLWHPTIASYIGTLDNSNHNDISSISAYYARKAFPEPSENGTGTRRNAFRHVLWTATMAKKFGSSIATQAWRGHEFNPNALKRIKKSDYSNLKFMSKGFADEAIDIANNKIGVSFGLTMQSSNMKDIAFKVLKKFRKSGYWVIANNYAMRLIGSYKNKKLYALTPILVMKKKKLSQKAYKERKEKLADSKNKKIKSGSVW